MFYFVKSPWLLKLLYPTCLWKVETKEKILYLTFDDGPHPVVTSWVLDLLNHYNAKATFFCIGNNVSQQTLTYEKIKGEGHAVGNHTYDHLNGWKTSDEIYLQNILKAKEIIHSNLFRPPYGRITNFQLRQLSANAFKLRTVMWSVLSGDFDKDLSDEQCFLNVARNGKPGSIIVFHDSEKAFNKLKIVLPKVLDYFSKKGFKFESMDISR